MTHPLRFQVLALPNVPWVEQLSRAQHVEELGFDVLATGDHLVDWTGPKKPFFESMTALSAIAAKTTTLRITTAVAQIGLRHPAVFAHMAVTMDHLSGGRFEPGIGTGLRIDPGTEMAGLENWSNAERVARLDEYADVVGRLMSQEVTHYQGRFYRIEGMVTNPLPIQKPRPPILLAAMGPKMLTVAAKRADIWNSLSFKADWNEQMVETRARAEQMRGACDEIGRNAEELRWSFTLFEPDSRHRGGAFTYYETPDVFASKVAQLRQLGMTEISIYYPLDSSQLPVFEEIARDVIPELRGSGAP